MERVLRGLINTLTAPFSIFWNNAWDESLTNKHNESLKEWIRQNYKDLNLTEDDLNKFIDQYGDTADAGIFGLWGQGDDNSDKDALKATLDKLRSAYTDLGEAPERLSEKEINAIRQQAYDEINAENQQLLDLYNESFQNISSNLQNSLYENNAMFNDYRNQMLTNNALNQQAIAGSTRYELDRQQRNAITRGASAAQRLVANINAQLGTQAQSAQQSLDTSNALAQNLLAQRQAQQGIRTDYMNAQNQYNSQVANTLSGQAERRQQYGQSKVNVADADRERAYQSWVDRRDEYFRGDSFGSTQYGTGRKPKQTSI